MPFDGEHFDLRPEPPKPPAPRDTMLCVAIFVAAVGLLVAPLSLDALVDLVRVLSRR